MCLEKLNIVRDTCVEKTYVFMSGAQSHTPQLLQESNVAHPNWNSQIEHIMFYLLRENYYVVLIVTCLQIACLLIPPNYARQQQNNGFGRTYPNCIARVV